MTNIKTEDKNQSIRDAGVYGHHGYVGAFNGEDGMLLRKVHMGLEPCRSDGTDHSISSGSLPATS